jgi:4-diphosphocytidyl-2-C-methyl-D-erythritol kinase
LTGESQQNKIFSFQTYAWESAGGTAGEAVGLNDFETVVFERYTYLAELKKRLIRAGAATAMMTGSGSALFGLFPTRDGVSRAIQQLEDERTFRISLVSRVRFRSLWWRAMAPHIDQRVWPPHSRYVR